MNATRTLSRKRAHSGQTLVIAILTLGAMLSVGLVFLGLIANNVVNTGQSRRLSVAAQLAQAGARFAHEQLMASDAGADWRPVPTDLGAGNVTRDPDALYLRPGSGFGWRDDADPQLDLGGPDGLGPFSRVGFDSGRSLVRVRYAPADPSVFLTSTGVLRDPSKTRPYLIIESVGRPGDINLNDPTTLPAGGATQYRGFATGDEFRAALGELRRRDGRIVNSNKTIAFATVGLIERARSVYNKFDVSNPVEIGVPESLGVRFLGADVAFPLQFGNSAPVPNMGNPGLLTPNVPFGGSTHVNGNVLFYGESVYNLNATLGEMLTVSGTVKGANDNARLTIRRGFFNGGWQTQVTSLGNGTSPSLDSRSDDFQTVDGALRDGYVKPDASGFSRGVGRLEPPTLLARDPNTGLTRYDRLTKESGAGDAGRYGHGPGVFVNNGSDRQIRSSRNQRERVGSEESMIYDWLNPNNGQQGSGWQGAYYVPRGAFLNLLPDGFTITRDTRGPDEERVWHRPDGTASNLVTIRYRIGAVAGQPYIVNSLTPGVDIAQATIDYTRGQPFNGVLLFDGNVRVRGVIPTDVQLTVVSNATIYIEGSIVKGVTQNGVRLNRPSRSAIALMAKDYVALNTTQLFAPFVGQTIRTKQEQENPSGYNPIEMRASETMHLQAEVLLDPNSAGVPSMWTAHAAGYRPMDNPTLVMNPALLLTHTADNQGPTFLSMDVNLGAGNSTYSFYRTRFLGGTPVGTSVADGVYAFPATSSAATIVPNYASALIGGTDPRITVYGLGDPGVQVYPRFETIGFPILLNGPTPQENYALRPHETNSFSLRVNPIGTDPVKEYLLARAAIVPHDVRIEATLYAEEGCFFVIPGLWFNPNPNDRRENYNEGSTEDSRIQARLRRYQDFGALPEAPFYGEPLDVRVEIVGAISENMPPSIGQQAQWLQKWGWIPNKLGASGISIPQSHVPAWYDASARPYVPNLTLTFDRTLATGRVNGFDLSPANPYLRTDEYGRPLPPMPNLPVSPTLAYFGEVTP